MDVCLKCELCNGFFGDSGRWPRVLGCGHSICSLCIHLLLRNSAIICPKCSTPHPAMTPNMVPLNHTVLKILGSPFLKNLPNLNNPEDHIKVLTAMISQKLSVVNSESQEACRNPETSQGASPSPKKPEVAAEPSHHAGICDEHGQYLMFWCNKCLEWICRDCTIVTHPQSVCPITSIRQTLRDMQAKEDKLIKNTIKHFDENLRLFREKHRLLKMIRNQHRNHIKELQHITSLHREAERLLEREDAALHEAMSKGLNICFLLLESQGNLLEAFSLQDILANRLKAQEYQSAILSWFDPNLLKDSPDLVYSRELLGATESALATMKQKLALCGHSLTESQNRLALQTSKTNTQSQGDDVQDVEKLLFDSSADNSVTGWLVLSPTVLHKGKDEVDEQASDLSTNHDKSKEETLCANNLQDQNIDEARKTGAIKKQPERLPVKDKGDENLGTHTVCYPPDEMQVISRENLKTVNDMEGGQIRSIELHQIIKESIMPDKYNCLMSIIGKGGVCVEVKDIIRRSLSIKSPIIARQLLAIKANSDIENVEEKERTILLVAPRELGNVANSLKEKDGNDESTDQNNEVESTQGILKNIEDVENPSGNENSHTSEMRSQDSETCTIEDLEHSDNSGKKLLSTKTCEAISKDNLINNENEKSDSVSTGGDYNGIRDITVMNQNEEVIEQDRNRSVTYACNEADSRNEEKSPTEADDPRQMRELVEVIELKENVEEYAGEESEDIPDIKKGADLCKPQ